MNEEFLLPQNETECKELPENWEGWAMMYVFLLRIFQRGNANQTTRLVDECAGIPRGWDRTKLS